MESATNERLQQSQDADIEQTSKSVVFALESNQIHQVMHVDDYTNDEFFASWYTKGDFDDMMDEAFDTIDGIVEDYGQMDFSEL